MDDAPEEFLDQLTTDQAARSAYISVLGCEHVLRFVLGAIHGADPHRVRAWRDEAERVFQTRCLDDPAGKRLDTLAALAARDLFASALPGPRPGQPEGNGQD